MTDKYEINEIAPLQVAGDDTIQDLSRSVTYSNYIRNLDTI